LQAVESKLTKLDHLASTDLATVTRSISKAETALARADQAIARTRAKYGELGNWGGEGFGKYQGNLIDSYKRKLLNPAPSGVRLADNEIVVFASTPKQGSFILRNGIDDKAIGDVIQAGKSVTIATDLKIKTEFSQMFGLERASNLRRGDTLSAAFVEDIRAAGFDVIYAPTRANHLHSRIIPAANNFDSEEARELLSLAFDRISRVKKDSK
jgi:hypothetical protein